VLPDWLHDIFLGYGDPGAAQYTKLPNTLRTLDFKVSLLGAQCIACHFTEGIRGAN
jgi:intron-binding protein aquarius